MSRVMGMKDAGMATTAMKGMGMMTDIEKGAARVGKNGWPDAYNDAGWEVSMSNNIRNVIFPNIVGIGLMVLGWYISILNVGLSRFQSNVLFTTWTLLGLVLIMIGAYMPRIWSKISRG